MSLREQIQAKDDRRSEVVPVPEWDCDVTIKSISLNERNAILRKFKDVDDPTEVGIATQFVITVMSCYDAEGTLIFSEDDAWLMDKSPEVIDRLSGIAFRISGMDKDAVDAGKDGSSSTTPKTSTPSA